MLREKTLSWMSPAKETIDELRPIATELTSKRNSMSL